jgi:hypothetical protein
MKDLLAFGEDAVDFTSRDQDATLSQLLVQQRLGDVVVVILIQDVTDEFRSEVPARHYLGGQRRQQALAVGCEDPFTQITRDLAMNNQLLHYVWLFRL